MLPGHVPDRGQGIHHAGIHRPGACDHTDRLESRGPVGGHQRAQRADIHAVFAVDGHEPQRVAPEAEQLDRPADARVRFGGRVEGGLARGAP